MGSPAAASASAPVTVISTGFRPGAMWAWAAKSRLRVPGSRSWEARTYDPAGRAATGARPAAGGGARPWPRAPRLLGGRQSPRRREPRRDPPGLEKLTDLLPRDWLARG